MTAPHENFVKANADSNGENQMQSGTDGQPFWMSVAAEAWDARSQNALDLTKGAEQAISSTAPRMDGGISQPTEWANAIRETNGGFDILAADALTKKTDSPTSRHGEAVLASMEAGEKLNKHLTGDIAVAPDKKAA